MNQSCQKSSESFNKAQRDKLKDLGFESQNFKGVLHFGKQIPRGPILCFTEYGEWYIGLPYIMINDHEQIDDLEIYYNYLQEVLDTLKGLK